MKQPINWKDHVVQYPNRYKVTQNGDGTETAEKVPGEVIQQGTPMNAANFNNIDLAAIQAIIMSNENSRIIRHLMNKAEALEGEQIEVTLTNSRNYPFNNSKKTVQLLRNRNRKNYTVIIEILSKEGGAIGDLYLSDKLLNGFKVEYTGSAKKVVLNCIVQGGM